MTQEYELKDFLRHQAKKLIELNALSIPKTVIMEYLKACAILDKVSTQVKVLDSKGVVQYNEEIQGPVNFQLYTEQLKIYEDTVYQIIDFYTTIYKYVLDGFTSNLKSGKSQSIKVLNFLNL